MSKLYLVWIINMCESANPFGKLCLVWALEFRVVACVGIGGEYCEHAVAQLVLWPHLFALHGHGGQSLFQMVPRLRAGTDNARENVRHAPRTATSN